MTFQDKFSTLPFWMKMLNFVGLRDYQFSETGVWLSENGYSYAISYYRCNKTNKAIMSGTYMPHHLETMNNLRTLSFTKPDRNKMEKIKKLSISKTKVGHMIRDLNNTKELGE